MSDPITITLITYSAIMTVAMLGYKIYNSLEKDEETGKVQIKSECCNAKITSRRGSNSSQRNDMINELKAELEKREKSRRSSI